MKDCYRCYHCTAFFLEKKYIVGSSANLFYFLFREPHMGCNFNGNNSNNSNILYKSITYAEQTVTNVPVVPILPA